MAINGDNGIETSGAGKTVTVSGIDTTAGATALLATKGVASFDSAHFTVASGFVTLSGGVGAENFLTDDGAPAVEPDGSGVVSILGGTGIETSGQGPGTTVTVSGLDATTAIKGISTLATNAEVIDGSITSNVVVNPSSLKAKLGVQTDHGLILGTGNTTALSALAPGSTGELLVSTTGADPSWSTTSYGDFSFTNVTGVGTPRLLSVANTDVNAASHADLRLSTPPLGGDSTISWEVQGSHFFAAGVDNQVAGDPWKLSNSSYPSAGSALIQATNAGAISMLAGNLDVTRDTSGAGTVSATIANSDNTAAASNAALNLSVGGITSTGDPYVNWLVTGSNTYSMGIDNSASDELKITSGANPSAASTLWSMTTAGERTMPLQPAFCARLTAGVNNVTGDGTAYNISFTDELFDQGADYATPSFTAPVNGRYYLSTIVMFKELGAAHTLGEVIIKTSNNDLQVGWGNYAAMRSSSNYLHIMESFLMDMDAADTAYVRVEVSNGTKTVDIFGDNARIFCGFSGYLVC